MNAVNDVSLKWHGPSSSDLEPQIVSELRELMEDGLRGASSLIVHNVMIGDSDGPVVEVWGEKDEEGE